MSRSTGAGPTASSSMALSVVRCTRSSGVLALETATQGVCGWMPEAISSSASWRKRRPGHVDDQRCVLGECALPFWRELQFVGCVVGGGEDELRGRAAVGQRCLQFGRDGECRRNSRNNLEWNSSLGERGDLFARAAKDQRVARLQPQHRSSSAGVFQHQRMNARLGDARLPAALADGDDQRRGESPARGLRRRQGRRAG